MNCPKCQYQWQSRTENPKSCPRCKQRLDVRHDVKHVPESKLIDLQSLFHCEYPVEVESDYNYANVPGSLAVTIHNLTEDEVRKLADVISY